MNRKSNTNKEPIPFLPSPNKLQARIREIAAVTKNVYWSTHARERMEERSISDLDALRVLREGHIDGNVVAGKNKGEWKCKLTKRLKGRREVGVITIVSSGNELFIKTVEWEDLI